jgi:sucrose-6F-phosphate phosphohydrolase
MRPPHIRLFSTDLDGTLLGHPEATIRFGELWAALPPHRRPLLVYNTSRTVAATQATIASRGLPDPEFIIGSVGTELHDTLYNRGGEYGAQFGEAWDVSGVEQVVESTPGIRRQPPEFSHALKSSWFWSRARHEQLDELARRLAGAGIEAAVYYSCRYFLDIVPARAGKGAALEWLCRRLSIDFPDVVVAGDSGNDNSMFDLPGINGIVVSNALPELHAATAEPRTFLARQPMADGVVEGLAYFGVRPEATWAGPAKPAERGRPAGRRSGGMLPLT